MAMKIAVYGSLVVKSLTNSRFPLLGTQVDDLLDHHLDCRGGSLLLHYGLHQLVDILRDASLCLRMIEGFANNEKQHTCTPTACHGLKGCAYWTADGADEDVLQAL